VTEEERAAMFKDDFKADAGADGQVEKVNERMFMRMPLGALLVPIDYVLIID
jgi:hypothetical protein